MIDEQYSNFTSSNILNKPRCYSVQLAKACTFWVVVELKATLVFIFGPNLKTKTLLRPRPKLNKNSKLVY